jgi:hypothetical protein
MSESAKTAGGPSDATPSRVVAELSVMKVQRQNALPARNGEVSYWAQRNGHKISPFDRPPVGSEAAET